MPPLIRELMGVINRMPASTEWRRLRIALTADEVREFREFIRKEGQSLIFHHAIRGVPIVIEPQPTHPIYSHEAL